MVDLDKTKTPPKDVQITDRICPRCTGQKSPLDRMCIKCSDKQNNKRHKRFR